MLVFIYPDGGYVYNLLNLTYMYLSWDRLSTNNSKMKGTDMSNHEKNEEEGAYCGMCLQFFAWTLLVRLIVNSPFAF